MSNKFDNPVLKKVQAEIDENKVISELEQEYDVSELLDFNEFNIGEKLQWNSFMVEKFRMLYISEKQKLGKLETNFNKVAGEKYDYYKYKDGRDLGKVEIERYYLTSDPELVRMKKIMQLQEVRVQFFEAITEAFKSQGFNMKNFLQNLQIGS